MGQFGTGTRNHGAHRHAPRVDVADRPNAEIDRFTRHGQYHFHTQAPAWGHTPATSTISTILGVVGALARGPDRPQGSTDLHPRRRQARIDDPAEGRTRSRKNSSTCTTPLLHKANGKLYVIAQAWNPGRLRDLRAGHVSSPALTQGELADAPLGGTLCQHEATADTRRDQSKSILPHRCPNRLHAGYRRTNCAMRYGPCSDEAGQPSKPAASFSKRLAGRP